MSSIKMKKFVSIKGVIENIRQSVNSPAPAGGPGGSAGGPVKLEQEIIESLIPDQVSMSSNFLALQFTLCCNELACLSSNVSTPV
jgi:hypothetical protein